MEAAAITTSDESLGAGSKSCDVEEGPHVL
jgi:hypothetical protein